MILFTLLAAAPVLKAQEGAAGRVNEVQADTLPKKIDLKEVTITAEKPPFVLRNDTLEFDAASVRLLPNAMVKDLLKKLPGVEIDKDGVITVNGRKVNKIRLDGREFFEGNIEAALRNLPGNIISKVQVADTKTLAQQRSLAVQPPSNEVTINLTLKKDKRIGRTGNASAGAGTRQTYIANAFLNTLSDPLRLSLYTTAGNVGDGAMGMRMPNQGITASQSAGLSLNTQITKKLLLDGNYSFSHSKIEKTEETFRRNFLPDSSFNYRSTEQTVNYSTNHNLSLNFTYEADSLTVLTVRPTVGWGGSKADIVNNAVTETTSGNALQQIRSGRRSTGDSWSSGIHVGFNKSSRNRRVNLDVNWSSNVRRNTDDETNTAGGSLDSLRQRGNSGSQNSNNYLHLNLSGKLAGGWVVAFEYQLDQQGGELKKETFDEIKGGQRDSILSAWNKNTQRSQVPSLQLGYKNDRLSVALNMGMRYLYQQNRLLWADTVIEQRQRQFSPSLQFNYNFKGGNLVTNYSISSAPPTGEQLSPLVNNSNPVYITQGNPFLKTAVTHMLMSMARWFEPRQGLGLNLTFMTMITGNQVVNDLRYDEQGRQFATFRNVNGTGRWSLSMSGFKSRKIGDVRLQANLGGNGGNTREAGFIEGRKNVAGTWRVDGRTGFSAIWKEIFTLNGNFTHSINSTTYSLPELRGLHYHTNSVSGSLEANLVKRMQLVIDCNYSNNPQLPGGFKKSNCLLNSSLGYRFLEKEQLTLSIDVIDILNGNNFADRQYASLFDQVSRVNGIGFFGMVKLKCNF